MGIVFEEYVVEPHDAIDVVDGYVGGALRGFELLECAAEGNHLAGCNKSFAVLQSGYAGCQVGIGENVGKDDDVVACFFGGELHGEVVGGFIRYTCFRKQVLPLFGYSQDADADVGNRSCKRDGQQVGPVVFLVEKDDVHNFLFWLVKLRTFAK